MPPTPSISNPASTDAVVVVLQVDVLDHACVNSVPYVTVSDSEYELDDGMDLIYFQKPR